MSTDIREVFDWLVLDAPPPPTPEAVRDRARLLQQRRRARTAAMTCVAVIVTGAVAAAAVDARRGSRESRLTAVGGSPEQSARPTPTAPATQAPAGGQVRPWLREPWVLLYARSYEWPGAASSGYRFCGEPVLSGLVPEPVAAAEQTLGHPSGRRARLVSLTPERAGGAIQLFKLSYASCVAKGAAEGVGGPRNLWSYGALSGAAEMHGRSLHVAEVTGPDPEEAASRADAAAVLDQWAR